MYARVLGGGRIDDTAPKQRKGNVRLLAALTSRGRNAEACRLHEGSVDPAAFLS
ncbi:MAG: hypothetical protein ACRCYY_09055 [Trueperaceae bacterium]